MITEEIQAVDPVSAESESPSVEINGILVDPEIMFSNARGIYKKRIEKRQRKLLSKIGFLKPFLEEDEQVILVTMSFSPLMLLEQLLDGWFIIASKRALLIFTDRRVFHIPAKPNLDSRYSISYFVYSDCKSIRISGRSLVVKYHQGSQEKFYYICGRELKKVKHLFKDTPMPEPDRKSTCRIHLCPECTAPLHPQLYTCLECGLSFKNRKRALRLSMLLPGGGYFYTGHWGLGVVDALAEAYLIFFVSFVGFLYLTGQSQVLFKFIFFGLLLALGKLITIHQTDHFIDEYIPVK